MLEFKFIFGINGYRIAESLRNTLGSELGGNTEFDEFDENSYHFVGYDKTQLIAAARLYQIDDKNFRISFVSIKEDYRRQYVGDLVMRALQDKAVALGGTAVILEAPLEVKGFFEFEEYEAYGDEFEIDGKKYTMMKKDLTKVHPCRGCKK